MRTTAIRNAITHRAARVVGLGQQQLLLQRVVLATFPAPETGGAPLRTRGPRKKKANPK